jgi:arylsulfatase
MVATRGIWHKGWKAATEHAPFVDTGHFDTEPWQLFHVDEDRAEAHDLAAKYPDKLEALKQLWLSEAEKYNVLPLNDLGLPAFRELEFKVKPPATGRYVYYPGTTEVPEASAARTLGSSFKILAEVEFTAKSEGIIVAQGSRFGGYAMFVKGGRLVFVYNFLGIPPEQRLECAAPAPGTHIVGVEFAKASIGKNHEALGTMTLHVDDKPIASGDFRTQTGHYSLCGEGLCVGYDIGDAVSADYTGKFPFSGGTIIKVLYDVADDVYVDLERKLAAAIARD